MFQFRVKSVSSAARVDPERKRKIGAFVIGQIRERFRTRGRSGGANWDSHQIPKWGGPRQGPLLGGVNGRIMSGWTFAVTSTGVLVYNEDWLAEIHHLGTVGKGGVLPTIVPRNAKALFVPITKRGREARPLAVFGGQKPFIAYPSALKKGQLKDGKLVPPDADYIFLQKVDLPPRPQLPDSKAETDAQKKFITEVLRV